MITARKAILAALGWLLLVAPLPAIAAPRWLRADTHNFVIYSSGDEKELRRFATEIEEFDALLRKRFNVPAEDQPTRLTIYMLGSQDAVANVMGNKDRWVAGFYSPEAEGSYAVANREKAASELDLSGDTVLFHEYAHHMMFRQFTFAYPAWFVEGFAEYFSTATFAPDGTWTLGKPASHRAYGLFAMDKLPIEKVLFESPEKLTADQREVFYGRSWLLVHFLYHEPSRKGQLTDYIQQTGAGIGAADVAPKVFGDLKALDRELDKYAEGRLHYIKSSAPIDYDHTLTVTALDPVDSQLVMLGLRRRNTNGAAQAFDQLEALAKAQPGRAAVWYELGATELALSRQSDDDAGKKSHAAAAESAIDHALAIDPNHGRANILKAELVMDRLSDQPDYSAVKWREVRAMIGRGNRADTTDPLPLYYYYQSYVRQHLKPPQMAYDGLAAAFSRAPEASELRSNWAFALAGQGKYDEAMRLVEILAHDPHNGAEGEALVDQIRAMREAEIRQQQMHEQDMEAAEHTRKGAPPPKKN